MYRSDTPVIERVVIPTAGQHTWVPLVAPLVVNNLVITNVINGTVLSPGHDYTVTSTAITFINNTLVGIFEAAYPTVGWSLAGALLRQHSGPALYSYLVSPYRSADGFDHTYVNAIIAGMRAVPTDQFVSSNLTKEIADITQFVEAQYPSHHTVERLPVGASANVALPIYERVVSDAATYVIEMLYAGYTIPKDAIKSSIMLRLIDDAETVAGQPGDDATLRVTGNDVFYESLGSVDFTSNVDNTDTFKLQAGLNALTVESNSYGDMPALRYNTYPVMTPKNISGYLSKMDFGEQTIITGESDTVELRGNGSVNDPLRAFYRPTMTSYGRYGMTKLSRNYDGRSQGDVIEADIIRKLFDPMVTAVPASRTINGIDLTCDVVITAADIGLEVGKVVDNTSDADKPISAVQSQFLAQYSSRDHTHPNWNITATNDVPGIAKLNTEWTGKEKGFVAPCAMTHLHIAAALTKGVIATYAGEEIDPDALYAVIRDNPTIKRGSKINLVKGEEYMAIK